MREQLAQLHSALQNLKNASMFRKALAAEAAIEAAVVLIEQMLDEIEKLKSGKENAEKKEV